MTTVHPGTAQATAVTGNWIGGAWSMSGTVAESVSPSTGAVLGTYVSAGAAEAQQGIDAARAAFDTTDWSRDPNRRYRAILELADRLEARTPEIAASLSSEGGKLLGEVMWEVGTTPTWLRYSAATAITQGYGRAAEVAPGVYFQSVPEAAGVVGVITPWNSPINRPHQRAAGRGHRLDRISAAGRGQHLQRGRQRGSPASGRLP
jgi:acyl-CoA reductase-like NAD-dependent aldehyde dehydrogenase